MPLKMISQATTTAAPIELATGKLMATPTPGNQCRPGVCLTLKAGSWPTYHLPAVSGSHAALAALPSSVAATWICFGFASARLAIRIVNSPLS